MEHREHHEKHHAEPEQPSAVGRFFKGFFSSASKSALMMGIFGALQMAYHAAATPGFLATITTATALSAATIPLLLIASIGIFGGIMAAYNSDHHAAARDRDATARNVVLGVTATELSRAPMQEVAQSAPTVMAVDTTPQADQPAQRNWTDRPDIAARADRSIESILASKGTAESHAAAIAERQASASASPTIH